MKMMPAFILLSLATALWAPRASAVADWEVTATDVATGVIPLGALYLTHHKDDDEGRDQYLWSMGTTLLVVNGARLAFKEHEWGTRPNGHPYGFPSGHVAFIGGGAAFLQDRYGWRWGVPAWLATGYTAYVRVEDDHHRWRDVAASAVLAAGISQYFVSPYRKVHVTPILAPGEAGLRLQAAF